jgi:type II restriction enzyme
LKTKDNAMELVCDLSVASGYQSAAQIARVVSETWLARNGYCLTCESESLDRSAANTKSTDFVCPQCGQNYELKTFRKRPAHSLVDGAYSSLMARITNGTAPTLFLLERNYDWSVQSLTAIHSLFLTPSVIEKRRPLSASAIRAGWVGCNIRLDRIGTDGEIRLIEKGRERPQEEARARFRRFAPLSSITPRERGWTTLTLSAVRGLDKKSFSLAELYEREHLFRSCYPRNRNIRPKIRQQLQMLRALGLIQFKGNGKYEFIGQ